MNTEERLVELETRLAQQDDLLETLNRTVYRQQKKIDELETLLTALARHVKDARDAAATSPASLANERPPHY